MRKSIVSACGGLVLAAISSLASAETVDAKLLDMLKANGSITAAQYAELTADLAKEQEAQNTAEQQRIDRAVVQASTTAPTVTKKDFDDFANKVAWATKTVVAGDVRVRQESISVENRDPERVQDRQRIRARVGFVSQPTSDVETGVRIASGNNNDARSTNQDLDNYFTKKDLWLDRAYLNWHPADVPGLQLIGGKMAQPWVAEDQLIWDDDINPEGIASLYQHKFGGVTLFGSTGAFTLKNNVDGQGNQFTEDLRMISGQLGVRFTIAENVKVQLGGSLYHYHLDGDSPTVPPAALGLAANGNTTTQFQIYEGFGQVDIGGLPMPLSFYGQYAQNANANGPEKDEDDGWLLGVKSKIWLLNVNYNYRNLHRNAVVGAFTDSDFAVGTTAARGSKFQVSYDISKNLSFVTTYFMTEGNAVSTVPGSDADTWQIDLLAKF